MKTLRLTLLVCFTFAGSAVSIFAQGSLTPPAAPGPTMKTLNQIEGRTVIDPSVPGFATPYNITQSGSYYLNGNINISNGSDAIVISADNVTLDLNGFALISTSNPAAGTAVLLSGIRANILIRNGNIRGQVTYNGTTFSGSGFSSGVNGSGMSNVRVIDLAVLQCKSVGIALTFGSSTSVEHCTVKTASFSGISGTNISRSIAFEAGDGIIGDHVSDSRGHSVGVNGTGIKATVVTDSYGSSVSGVGILGTFSGTVGSTATNCYGSGISGIVSETVANCVGNGSTGAGIHAQIANNSEGQSNSGIGLQADLQATNCRGVSTSGNGLEAAVTANACFGSTGNASAIGLKVTGTANVCGGQNTANGVAIQAVIGIGCGLYGGTASITNKYNMP